MAWNLKKLSYWIALFNLVYILLYSLVKVKEFIMQTLLLLHLKLLWYFSLLLSSAFISEKTKKITLTTLQFHGDFYCIEFHRNEVACNGLLFNNIYLEPSVKLTDEQHTFYTQITANIAEELLQREPSEIVLRALLQLFLAKSSSIKMNSSDKLELKKDEKMDDFRILLEENFLTLHKPGDYASLLSITPNSLTKQCNNRFGKTPTQLIQERLILEAKKHLHLTRLSIKEIAFALKFQDEYYFSRVFKKMTKMSPQMFRKTTGISIVADLSKE